MAKSMMRPETKAGPMDRNDIPLNAACFFSALAASGFWAKLGETKAHNRTKFRTFFIGFKIGMRQI